eukprot:746509_1
MEHVWKAKDNLIRYCQDNPKIAVALCVGSLLYLVRKGRNQHRYSQTIFETPSQIRDKVILITGCGHGFGHDLALQLAINHGYRVIATCRTQESVDEFLSNSAFTANKSTSLIMDVTNEKHIANAKTFVVHYLDETQSIFWGIVNNAGLSFFAPFEMVSVEKDKFMRDVLFSGPMHIIRTFMPLLPGRKNYKPKDPNNKLEYSSDGGRIVNISSIAARIQISDVRYGVSKAAITYATHALRKELSPRFGIWCSVIEPGGFQTNILEAGMKWTHTIVEEVKANEQEELLDVYEHNVDGMDAVINKIKNKKFAVNCQPVIDDMVHALTAKYPKREYVPGNNILYRILERVPLSVLDFIALKRYKKMNAAIQGK